MGSVVLLRGVNVGGHRTFRPSVLAKKLSRFDAVNVGAAGTFVIRKRASHAELRAAIMRHLPFETHVMICRGGDIIRLVSDDPFAGQPAGLKLVRFVSVLAKRRAPPSPLPLNLPSDREWGVRVLAQDGRFVLGIYRRNMKAVGYLGQLDKVFGVPVTTRNWNTIQSIARVLADAG